MILPNKYMHVITTQPESGLWIAQHIYPTKILTHVAVNVSDEEIQGIYI